ncbi:hypothetical protein Q4574_00505 [Aliiglaciecola sp. 3_MG-2023]|uniref:capsular polysaccharide export protein, LipB/KpsS family n=1 Tax=Aliiglaciecola sp. 3_MG-2023 TaxID=3062644 RepID=UPI0026E30A0E|nr:hypothetical protein [Aliiglaciecola sp. 3_MG-2023]MDO6691736.1 hypothetical protein [Aliiglaciecola sp. 3_MG-2023]
MNSVDLLNIPSVLFLDRPFASGLVHLWLREYFFSIGFNILDDEIPPWKKNTKLTDCDKVENDYLSELDWDEMARHTIARLNGRYSNKVETPQQKIELINQFKLYASKMENAFTTKNVKVAIIFGNYRIETKLAAYFSEKYQAQLICIESFFLQNYFYLEANSTQIANHHGFVQKWPFIRNLKVTSEQLEILERLMRDRECHGLLNGYISMPAASQELPEQLLVVAERKRKNKGKIGLLLGQMPHDAVIVNDLTAFPTQIEFLSFIITEFLSQCTADDTIVCRLHPLEARYGDDTVKHLHQQFGNHPQVILFSGDDCNTYQLMELVDFGVVANSQSGLEMIYRDKPLLVCGNPYYSVEMFCLQATDRETIQVQLTRLLAGWHPSEKKLQVAKHYLCGLIFHHLCPRNKTEIWNRLNNISAIQILRTEDTLNVTKQHKQLGMSLMPNAKVGRIKLKPPTDINMEHKVLVIGSGTFSYHFAEFSEYNLTFSSDLPADCEQTIGVSNVHLLDEQLVIEHHIIVFCWPLNKCRIWLSNGATTSLVNKTLYYIEKIQQEDQCEYQFKPINSSGVVNE